MKVSNAVYNWRGLLVLTLDTPEHGRMRIPVSEVRLQQREGSPYAVWDVTAMGSIAPWLREDCPAARKVVDRWWNDTEPHKNYKLLKPLRW